MAVSALAAEAAQAVLTNHAIQPHWRRTGDQIKGLLEEAAEAVRIELLEQFADLAVADKTRDASLLAIEEFLEDAGVKRDWIGA